VRRRLFNVLSAVSLLLCAASTVVWVRCNRTFFAQQAVHITAGPEGWDIMCGKSATVLWKNRIAPPILRPTTLPKGTTWVGVSYGSYFKRMPYWEIQGIFGILPFCWIAMKLRRPKAKTSPVCVTCGYDLRATPDRCPECGTVTRER
jgi:hypothetical protein